jgi:hypothetical protein
MEKVHKNEKSRVEEIKVRTKVCKARVACFPTLFD